MSFWDKLRGAKSTSQPGRSGKLDYLSEGLALEKQGDYDAALTSYRLAQCETIGRERGVVVALFFQREAFAQIIELPAPARLGSRFCAAEFVPERHTPNLPRGEGAGYAESPSRSGELEVAS